MFTFCSSCLFFPCNLWMNTFAVVHSIETVHRYFSVLNFLLFFCISFLDTHLNFHCIPLFLGTENRFKSSGNRVQDQSHFPSIQVTIESVEESQRNQGISWWLSIFFEHRKWTFFYLWYTLVLEMMVRQEFFVCVGVKERGSLTRSSEKEVEVDSSEKVFSNSLFSFLSSKMFWREPCSLFFKRNSRRKKREGVSC